MDASLASLDNPETAPATYSRGSYPIDTILVTRGIEIINAGYLPFGTGVGDHRPLYIDILTTSVLGTRVPPVISAGGRRLKLQDPRVVKKYNNILEIYL